MTDYATQKWIRNRLARDTKRREYLGNVATFVLVTTALVLIALAFNEWWEMSGVAEAYR